MKNKKPNMEKLKMMIRKIHKDPELMKIAKAFVRRHGGEISS